MACLRSKPADQVAESALATRADIASLKFLELFEPYGPYIDGKTVKGQPLDVARAGQFFKKPMLVGTTREETVLYIYGSYNKTVSIVQYLTLLLIERPDKFLEIAEHYKPSITTEDQRELLVNVSTDLVFWCPTRNLTRTLLGQGMGDTWMYLWDHAFSFPGWGPVTFCEGRVCHGTEIVYVFHTADKGNFTFTKEEELLSSSIMQYWTNFAWTGDPNIGHQGARQKVKGEDEGSGSLKVLSGLERTLAEAVSDKTGVQPKHGADARVALEIEASVDSQILKAKLGFSKRTIKGPQLVWPKYNGGTGWTAMHFQVPQNQIIEDYKTDRCNFWDSIGYCIPK